MASDADLYAAARAAMVEHDLLPRGVTDPLVLAAMGVVPRERFVDERQASAVYEDRPLPIEAGQTISQPLVVALMAQAAEIGPEDRVLEIGAGSGYGCAVLGRVAAKVWAIERHQVLAELARSRLVALGVDNVTVASGDGTLGWPDAAPFDAIVVTAATPRVPPALFEQLVDGGRLVIPLGPEDGAQELARVRRRGSRQILEALGPVRFVPLIGPDQASP